MAELENEVGEVAKLDLAGEFTRQGIASFGRGDHEGALALFHKAAAARPEDPGLLNNIGCTLVRLGRAEEALVPFERAMSLDGGDVNALSNYGAALCDIGRYDEALASLDKALALEPKCVGALNNRGRVLMNRDRLSEALACYDRALAVDPQHAEARYSRGSIYLSQGRLREGFQGHAARWDSPALLQAAKLPTKAPLWLGRTLLDGKTILLHHEQGLGDTLQFARYVPLVAQRGAQVILRVPDALCELMRTLPGKPRIISDRQPLPPHDYHCPLMSLPLAFGTTLETIPSATPYLYADPQHVAEWASVLEAGSRPQIGIVWAGRQYKPQNPARDMRLGMLRPLFDLDARFVSLQKELPQADDETLKHLPQLARHGEKLSSFADTAALIANLDLVICVDTSVAHLAGALGKPVWILNRYAGCWRWLRGRSDSPWYPKAQLFTQQVRGDWNGVVREAQTALAKWIAGRPEQPILSVPHSSGPVDPDAMQAVDSLLSRGLELISKGRANEALPCFEHVLQSQPFHTGALTGKGRCLAVLKRHSDALVCFNSVLEAEPIHVEALHRRAGVLGDLGRNQEALHDLDTAIATEPSNLIFRNSRGLLLERIGRYTAALADFEYILSIDSTHKDGLNNRGLALARMGRFQEALAGFDRTLEIDPANAQALYNRGIMRLALGDLPGGFRDFESRWKVAPLKGIPHPSPVPIWLGQTTLAGKTILIYHEQGYGDTLQFARFVPLLTARGAKVVLAVPPALKELMGSLPGGAQVVTEGDPMPWHELRCPLMSLPLGLETTIDTIPSWDAYLYADPIRAAAWRQRLGRCVRPRIGLVWSGRQYPPINIPRDMPLAALRPLFSLQADFISLQKDIPQGDIDLLGELARLSRHGEALADFADTAALIENLDLVITVDTAVAHLAGALGKPVWLMNRHASCWRWLLDRADSPWYPSVRLFRQKLGGDWESVVEAVREAVERFIASWKAPADLVPGSNARKLQQGEKCFARGDFPKAARYFSTVLQHDDANAGALNNLACTLLALGRAAESYRYFEKLLTLKPQNQDALANAAAALYQLGRYEQALTYTDRAIAFGPEAINTLVTRGRVLVRLGRVPEALSSYQRAAASAPRHVEALLGEAVCLGMLGRHEESLGTLNAVLSIAPENLEALGNRGASLDRLGRHAEALADFERVLESRPGDPDALGNRGQMLERLGRHQEALQSIDRALALRPDHVSARNVRATALIKLDRYDEALAESDRVLSLEPSHAVALANRGLALERAGRPEEALASYDRALAADPNESRARFNRSTVLLSLGDFARGLPEYESRWGLSDQSKLPETAPLWSGKESLSGKTIVLHHEQGLGDSLQFVRFASLLARQGAQVYVRVPAALRRLMRSLPDGVRVLSDGDPLPSHDFCCPLMSLPLVLGTRLDSIPAQVPYLAADAAAVRAWSERLGPRRRPRIGLVWAGRQYPPINVPRDMSLRMLLPLLDLDADFVSLQKDVPRVDRELLESQPRIAQYGESLQDFADTAALVENLDLLITVDTSVAHLAGALGKPVWILNRYASCWRWLRDRIDSPWYPTARLFRQASFGDWGGIVQAVKIAAEEIFAQGSSFQGGAASEEAKARQAGDRALLPSADTPKVKVVEKIKFVCATRLSSEEFFATSALGRSLANFREFPKGQPIELRLFQKNTGSLPVAYNTAIEEACKDPAILVFIHDDVLLCDFYWAQHLLEALDRFQIVGLSGNKRRTRGQPSWMYVDEHFTRDDPSNFSGVVGHGEGIPNLQQLSVYGPPLQEVKLLDGVMLAARSHLLIESGLRFDPQFDFDFYDLDFCRQAEARGIRMGTCAISVVHQSAGRLGKPSWRANYGKYRRKYGE